MISRESRPEDRSRPLSLPVELRIHGVGGTTAEVLLDHPHPVQVAGDDSAGFYRRPLHGEAVSKELEAYAWGGITSRSGSRALWLLLLPFALVNAAGFMLNGQGGGRMRLARALMRLLALDLTVLAVLWAGGLALDLVAYQCGGNPSCTSQHWWLTFFENPFFATSPTRRLVAGMVGPTALIGAWRLASSFTRTRYEQAFADEPVEDPETATARTRDDQPRRHDLAETAGLGSRSFWHSSDFGARLASGHFAAATSALAGATSLAIARLRDGGSISLPIDSILVAAAAVVGVGAAATVAGGGRGPTWLLVRAGWLLIGFVAALNLYRSGPLDLVPPDLPGYSQAPLIMGLVALGLGILLMGTLVGSGSGQMMPPVATIALAVFSGGAFLAGSHVRLADWLGDRVGTIDQPRISYSYNYDWFALAALAFFVTVLAAVVVGWVWVRRQSSSAYLVKIAADYGPRSKRLEGPEARTWLGRIARAKALAGLTERADVALAAVMGAVLTGSVAFYAYPTITDGSPIHEMPQVWRGLQPWVPMATWVGSSLPLLGLAVMYSSFRHPGTRRRVGVIWDVVTFWPRWFHPLAPPPYSARAVPELGIRLARLVDQGATVTLSAHSQGSVLAASALARLPTQIRAHLLLLTHGSPLRRLYGRFFPAYFGDSFLDTLNERIGGRWINLYRTTDPIGGPMGREAVDCVCRDPETSRRARGDPFPRVQGHTFYRGVLYRRAIRQLSRRLEAR